VARCESRGARACNTRRKQRERGDAADEQHLADRVGRKQPLADRVIAAKQKHAEQHQADAGEGGAAAAGTSD